MWSPCTKSCLEMVSVYCQVLEIRIDWFIELRFYVSLDTKQVILETFPKPISWHGMEKLNPTQQKHTFTNQKTCTTTQHKHETLEPRLVASYDIWPGKGEGLFWFWHFINLSLTYLLRHLHTYLQPQDPMGPEPRKKSWLIHCSLCSKTWLWLLNWSWDIIHRSQATSLQWPGLHSSDMPSGGR